MNHLLVAVDFEQLLALFVGLIIVFNVRQLHRLLQLQ